MFDQIFSQLKTIVSGLIIGVTAIFGIQTSSPLPTPSQEPEIIETIQEVTPKPIGTATPSATATIKPKPSLTLTPPPVPDPKIDLNIERIILMPEKWGGDIKESFSENQKYKFSQSNKAKSIWATIRNNGHENAEKVVINIIIDGETLKQLTIDKIEKQNSKNENWQLAFPDKIGNHRIELQVNPARLFLETRFDNNSKIVEYEYVD